LRNERRGLRLLLLLAALLVAAPAAASDPKPEPEPDTAGETPASAEEEARDAGDREEALEGEILEWEDGKPPAERREEAPEEIDPEAWGFRWRNGSWIERNDGLHRLHLGGRLLADFGVLAADPGLANAKRPGETRTAARIRQGRLLAQGMLWRRLLFKVEYDFASDSWTDVFVGASRLGPVGAVKVGQVKQPFSLERGMSRLNMTFMERSLALALGPSVRAFGFSATNTHADRRIRWRAGVFRDTDEFADFSNSDNTDLSFRITGLPVWRDEGGTLVQVGGSYSHTWVNGPSLRLRRRPESRLENRLVDTGAIAGVSGVDRMGWEISWVRGPFSAQAEYLHDFLDRSAGAGDLDFWGIYGMASYFLTGEHRIYGQRAGVFGRVIPRHDFRPWAGHWGAFQLAARLSYLDLDDADITGGRQTNVALGFNWYLFPNFRVMLNYVHAHVASQGGENIGQMRLQLDL
jgi:phosphate-selective porin OprO/OprP